MLAPIEQQKLIHNRVLTELRLKKDRQASGPVSGQSSSIV
jgi:hypothetical protein